MKTFTLKKTLGAVAALSLGLGMNMAHAVSAVSQFFPGTLNQISDNDAENLALDNNGNGFLDVGDTVRGISNFQTIEDLIGGGPAHVLGAGGVNELTAIFEAEVTSRTFVGNGFDGIAGTGDDLYNYSFGAYAPFAAEFGLPAGSVLALFDDAASNYDRTQTVAIGEASATGGALVLAYGLPGLDTDELFRAQNAQQNVDLSGLAAGTFVGTFQFQFTQTLNNTGLIFNQVAAGLQGAAGDTSAPCVADAAHNCLIDFNGSGQVGGTGGASTGYKIFTDFNATVNVAVPEIDAIAGTGALTLLGGALVLVGERRRRRS